MTLTWQLLHHSQTALLYPFLIFSIEHSMWCPSATMNQMWNKIGWRAKLKRSCENALSVMWACLWFSSVDVSGHLKGRKRRIYVKDILCCSRVQSILGEERWPDPRKRRKSSLHKTEIETANCCKIRSKFNIKLLVPSVRYKRQPETRLWCLLIAGL